MPTFSHHLHRGTAVHPDCLHAGGSVAGSVGCVSPRGRRHEWLWGLCFSSEWTRLTWAARWSPTGRMVLALNCNQWHVPGGWALHWIATSDMFRLQLRCSGGTSNLGVDAGLRGRLSFSLHASSFEGWCSPHSFRPSCCVELLLWGRCFVVGAEVGASRGVPAFKRTGGRPPGGPEDRPSLQKWTSLLDNQMDQPLRQLKWTCELSTALEDPPGRPTYVTMDLQSRQTWP